MSRAVSAGANDWIVMKPWNNVWEVAMHDRHPGVA